MKKNLGQITVTPCKPLASEITTHFTRQNAELDALIPVQLSEDANDGLTPTVEVLKGNGTPANKKPVYGLYYNPPDVDDDGIIGVITEGDALPVARATTAPAIVDADIGKGIVGGAAGVDGSVIAGAAPGARAANERATIRGGNTAAGTAENPAYYRIDLKGV